MSIKKVSAIVLLVFIAMAFGSHQSWAEDSNNGRSIATKVEKKQADSDKSTDYHFSPPAVVQGSSNKASESPNSSGASKVIAKDVSGDYKIMIGDRLNVKIFPEDQYVKGGSMQVSSEGNITLPLVGKVKVADKTLVEAGRLLARIIDQDYLVNAEVVIELTESALKTSEKKKKAIALGQVRRPGSYEFPAGKEKITLLELISMAGGFTEIANIKKIKVVHKTNGKKEAETVNGEALMSGSLPDIEIGDGDVVNVAESVF